MTFHLAQFNIARLTHPLEAPESQGFVDRLDSVNALADAQPGFVWRLQTDEGDATAIDPYGDPQMIVNLTVWEDAASLRKFTYQGTHGEVFRKRGEWFDPPNQPMVVLWWVPAGYLPSVRQATAKLDDLRAHGPTVEAFTFGRFFDMPCDVGAATA